MLPDKNSRWGQAGLSALTAIVTGPLAWLAGKFLGAVFALDLARPEYFWESIDAPYIPDLFVIVVVATLVWCGVRRGWFDLRAPTMAEGRNAWLRKFLWITLAGVATMLALWVPGIWFLLRIRWLWESEALTVATFEAIAAFLGVAWLGLRRSWYSHRVLAWGWSGLAFVTLVLLVLAVPAFQRLKSSTKDKAVLSNVRQLSAAADQYYLENGVSTVDVAHLVGATNYVKAINTVANETYPAYLTQGLTITVTDIAGARTVTYAP